MVSCKLVVVVPVYRHEDFLVQTLESIKNAYVDNGEMRVTVLNNKPENPFAKNVLDEHGYAFDYIENDKTLPLNENWNRCIDVAEGEWIHILHEDDIVLPDFYSRFFDAVSKSEAFGAFFCREFFINEHHNIIAVSRLCSQQAGILEDAASQQIGTNCIQPPSIIVSRDVYTKIGKFRLDLTHVLDWEMWYRICHNFPIWFEPAPLVGYRVHSQQVTTAHVESGESALDIVNGVKVISEYCDSGDVALAQKYATKYIIKCARDLTKQRNRKDAMRQLRILISWRPVTLANKNFWITIYWMALGSMKSIVRR